MSDSKDYDRIGEAAAHASSHELGGDDEITHSALVAHNHAPRHEFEGPDEIDVTGLVGAGCGVLNSIQYIPELFLGANLINSVDVDKTVLILNMKSTSTSNVAEQIIARLTSPTNIEVDVLYKVFSGVFVLEFEGGIIGVQRGIISIGGAETEHTATIDAIVVAKSVLFSGGYGGNSNIDRNASAGICEITNPTTITASRNSLDGGLDLAFEVLEFE